MLTNKRAARLLLQGVDDSDCQQIAAVVANTRYKCFNDWQVCTEGEAELLILGSDDPVTVRGMLNEPFHTLRLTARRKAGPASSSSLVSPLPYLAFAALLQDIDRRLALRDNAAQPQTLPLSPRPALAASRLDDEVTRGILAGEAMVRLRESSKPMPLRGREMEARMIRILQSRFVRIQELLELSGAHRDQCEALLYTLSITDLVEVIPGRRKPPPAAHPAAQASPFVRADIDALMSSVAGGP